MINAQKFGPKDNLPWARHYNRCLFEERTIGPALYSGCAFDQCRVHWNKDAAFRECNFDECEFYDGERKLSPDEFLARYPGGVNYAANGEVTITQALA